MEKRRIVITGVNGFVGHHLAQKLKSENITVIGLGHDKEASPHLKDTIDEYYGADLINEWPNIDGVDAIIHLAGLAAVGPSFDDPQKYINGNSAMVTNMCEHYIREKKKPRILIISSGAVYDSQQAMPISEEGIVSFSSPYAISKVLTEHQATYYKNRGLECIVARPFNHAGPGQNVGFIIPDFYKKLQEAGENDVIKVGNINTKRDYTDVRDIVDAYVKIILADKLEHDLYNVCSGKSTSGLDILEKLKQNTGKTNVTFEIDPALVRPTDIMDIYGDSSRLQNELGWKPTRTIDQIVQDFVHAQS